MVFLMPYNSTSELPESLKKLPVKAQQMFMTTFNNSYERVGEESAFKVAWAVVKKNFKKVDDKWVARGMGLDLFTFSMETKGEVFIQKGEDGEYYLEAVLSDVILDSQGKRFTTEALQEYANQINNHGISGFITHADWKEFIMKHSHLSEDAFVAKARESRKGILKAVRAVFENGKLWIKALIDKRYLNRVKEFNKVSIEALVPKRLQTNSEYKGGYVLGFALDNAAVNPRAIAQIVQA